MRFDEEADYSELVADEDTRPVNVHQNRNGLRQPPLSKGAIDLDDVNVTVLDGDKDVLDSDHLDSMINPVLYTRGVRSDAFYLILAGKVTISSGQEGFLLDQNAFNFMGVECLMNDNYVPDFTAKCIGEVKLLKITREDYRRALGHVKNQF